MASTMSSLSFIPILLYSQFFVRIPYPTESFDGQTIIVTGSNTGLGLEAARHLVRLGASKVILAVRTISKGEAAAENILTSTKATKNTVEVWQLDLSDYESIKGFAKRVEGLKRLDAVVQNAGILQQEFKTFNGEEAHIAVNVLGAVLLGLLVLPKLRVSANEYKTRTRLSFVGSDTQYVAVMKEAQTEGSLLDAFNSEEKSDMSDRYPTSKRLLLYAIREIAARTPVTQDSNVLINFMTPGLCRSTLFRDNKSWFISMFQELMITIFARTTEVGGRTLVHAVSPDLGVDTHGKFLMDGKIAKDGPGVDSEFGQKVAKRFNKELFRKLEDISPGVTSVL